MIKQKISAKAVATDIRSGMSDADMMEKYSLSARGLESLFRKLIENNVVTAAEISAYRQRFSKPGQSSKVQATSEASLPAAEPMIDPELVKAIIEDVRKGRHDYDIMIRVGMGRDELRSLLEQLVRLGILSAEEVEARKPRKIRQCPHCRGQLFDNADRCEQCGRKLLQPMSSVPSIRPGAKETGIVSKNISFDDGCAWDDYWKNRGSLGQFKAYFRTVSQCLRSPTRFFSMLPIEFGYWAPALFGSISIAMPVTFSIALLGLLTGGAGIRNVGWVLFLAVWVLFGASVLACIGLFISSLFFHGLLMLFCGAHRGFQATFRVVSYSCAASLFGLIPLVGWLAGNLWSIYLSGIGFREMHQTSTVRAFGAVLIPICAGAAVWVIFGLQYNPLTVSKQSASANKPMISTTSTGTEFKTDVGKFAIITPLPLVEKKLTANTGLGKVDVSIFGAKQGNIEYTVACSYALPWYVRYFQYLPHFFRPRHAERILDQYGGSIVKKMHGKLVSDTKITLDNNLGREVVIEAMDGVGPDVVTKGRAFLVRNRLYQIMVIAPHGELDTPEVNDFFESFRLLPE